MKLYDENIPVPGCTISNQEIENITHFSLAKHTSISKEKYPCDVLYIVDTGQVKMNEHTLQANDCLFVKANTLCGQEAITDTVYTEILIKEDKKYRCVSIERFDSLSKGKDRQYGSLIQ